MIEGYVGLIGGGKSLNATDRMTRYMAAGGVVRTNMHLIEHPWYNMRYADKMKEFKIGKGEIPYHSGALYHKIGGEYYLMKGDLCICKIKGGFAYYNSIGFKDYLRKRFKWAYQEGQYKRLPNEAVTGDLHAMIEKGSPSKPVLLVLDEAVDFFDTDDRGQANREFLSFLRHSRKQAVDVIFIAQEYSELNKRIRNQTHFIWTFWDMQTFKIPGIRSTLPPPWRNMILCQQWNKSMTGGPLKRVWKTRDADLFGCYRTDELFRSLKSADGKTDFSGEGDIKLDEGFEMKLIEKIALFACLLLSVLNFLRGGDESKQDYSIPPSQRAGVQSSGLDPDGDFKRKDPCKVRYGVFQRLRVNGEWRSFRVDGVEYKVGDMTPDGTVLALTESHVHIRDDMGNDTFIYEGGDLDKDTPVVSASVGSDDEVSTANG